MGVFNSALSRVGAQAVSLTFVTGTLSRVGSHLALAARRAPLTDSQGPWDTHLRRAMILARVWAGFIAGAALVRSGDAAIRRLGSAGSRADSGGARGVRSPGRRRLVEATPRGTPSLRGYGRHGDIVQHRPEPALDFGDRHVLARRIVLDLVALDLGDAEVMRRRDGRCRCRSPTRPATWRSSR